MNSSLGAMLEPLLALIVVLSLVGLIVRYIRSALEVRQQIKWVVFFAALSIVPLLVISLATPFLGLSTPGGLPTILLMFFTISLPIAIGVAIFRYRLYDIDRIISRTASYAILAGILAAAFFLSVALTQQLLSIEGQFGIVVSTLVVAALFNPLRIRVRNTVDRRFNRSRYDAQRVLDEFAVRLRENVELESMQSSLMSTTQETMQPSHLSLWVRDQSVGPSGSQSD